MAIHHQIEMIETYNDFSYIMYIICDMTSSYYSRIKNIVNIPIIICSTGLSILNTTELSDTSYDKVVIIRNCGIAFNLLIALSIAILNAYKITEKEFSFKTHSINFLKIHNKINIDLAKCKTTMIQVDVLDVVKEYNMLCESLCFHIPSHIQRYVKHNYRNYKQPFMLSQSKKGRRTSIISYYFNNDDSPKSNDSTLTTVTSTNTESSEYSEYDLEYGYDAMKKTTQDFSNDIAFNTLLSFFVILDCLFISANKSSFNPLCAPPITESKSKEVLAPNIAAN